MRAALLTSLVVVLAFVAVEDLRGYRIRNEALLLLIGLFVAFCLWRGDVHLLMSRGVFALIVLAALLVPYSLGLMGGGDAKLLGTAFFWVGPGLSMLFAIMLLAFSLVYIGGAKTGLLPSRRVGGRDIIPFGPSIAVAWIATLLAAAPA